MPKGNPLSPEQQANFHAALAKVLRDALCSPPQFEYNEHGHILLTIIGLNLTSRQEVDQLKKAGIHVSEQAEYCLKFIKRKDGCNHHRLVAGRQYKVVLVPVEECGGVRTTAKAREHGASLGYRNLPAEATPRICEFVSNKHVEETGFRYIAVPHDPIKDLEGYPRILFTDRDNGGVWIGAFLNAPNIQWCAGGAFAFLVPSS